MNGRWRRATGVWGFVKTSLDWLGEAASTKNKFVKLMPFLADSTQETKH
jgi:hypothetical protein